MKKILYAVVFLLGLSLTSVSCSTSSSPEEQAKKDARAIVRAMNNNDKKAEDKAWENYGIHKQGYENNGEGRRFQDAFDEAVYNEMIK